MKKNEWLESLSLADEKYVSEADPMHDTVKRVAKKRSKKKWISIAACIVVMAMVGALFIPYDIGDSIALRKYRGSEYYPLIEKLSVYKRQTNGDKNLFETLKTPGADLLEGITGVFRGRYDAETYYNTIEEAQSGIAIDDKYVETTDNQVSGVIEADILKRSEKYFYYLSKNELRIYPITGEVEAPIGIYDVSSEFDCTYYVAEMYLSLDCKTVIVIGNCFDKKCDSAMIKVVSLDVSDPTNITKKGCFSVEGDYVSSRYTNGKLLIVSRYALSEKMDLSDKKTFVPVVDHGNGEEFIPADCIFFPEEITSTRYLVINVLGESDLANEGCMAFLSYSNNMYVSDEDIYITETGRETTEMGKVVKYSNTTTITRISYKDKLENKGTVTVNGYIKDQYSLDVYNGILRVVTTTESWGQSIYSNGRETEAIDIAVAYLNNADLYCIDIETLEVVASVISFAPDGETVRSVRFDGDNAYVCTSIQRRDPVFFFDLSDLNNITYKDTGTIDGFSESLINFKNGTLLGIGTDEEWVSLKIEIYEETTDSVRSVCAYEKSLTRYPSNYKAYFIDREKGLVGLACYDYTCCEYILLQYDGYKLFELAKEKISYYNIQDVRAALVDNDFYIFNADEMHVVNSLYKD